MNLRLGTSEDISTIRDLAHRIWWAHYPELIGPAQVEYMLARNYNPDTLLRQMAEGQTFWLVELEGLPAGFVAVSRQEEGRYFIHKFYLDNARRGLGLGAAVFQVLLTQYPDAQEIRLTVNRQNFKSVNFYFKIGFHIEQCVDIEIGQGFVMNDFQMLWRKGRQ